MWKPHSVGAVSHERHCHPFCLLKSAGPGLLMLLRVPGDQPSSRNPPELPLRTRTLLSPRKLQEFQEPRVGAEVEG